MDPRTRSQLLALSESFYRAHAEAFDASRGHQAWPGWKQLLHWLPSRGSPEDRKMRDSRGFSVLDIGCGNARLARFLIESGFAGLHYVGVDANAELLTAARERLADLPDENCVLIEQDFLSSDRPGAALPSGPFDLIAVMGVLHHVPGRDWRLQLLRAATERLSSRGLLALATWQFAGRERFVRRTIDWKELGPVLGQKVSAAELEEGDFLLRFGEGASLPPRYCHQVADLEFESWPDELELDALDDYRADGADGDLNRYRILRRR